MGARKTWSQAAAAAGWGRQMHGDRRTGRRETAGKRKGEKVDACPAGALNEGHRRALLGAPRGDTIVGVVSITRAVSHPLNDDNEVLPKRHAIWLNVSTAFRVFLGHRGGWGVT